MQENRNPYLHHRNFIPGESVIVNESMNNDKYKLLISKRQFKEVWSRFELKKLFIHFGVYSVTMPLSCHSLISGSERSIKIAVLVGYSKSVLLGGHGWASGSLSDYIPDNTSLTQDSVLLQNQQFLNTDIGPSDASMAQAAVCETEKGRSFHLYT